MKKLIYGLFFFSISTSLFSQAFEINPSSRHKIMSDSASLTIGTTSYNMKNSGMLLFNENVNNPYLCGFGILNNGEFNKLYFTGGCEASYGSLGSDTLMTIDRSNGKIGILTSEPTSELTVNGDLELNGEIIANKTVTRCISISGLDFHVLDQDYKLVKGIGTNNFVYFDGGEYSNLGYAYKGIELPQGAEITSLTGYIYDNSAVDFVRIRLQSINHSTGYISTILSNETSGPYAADSFTSLTDSTPLSYYNIVDNNNKSYSLEFTGVQDRTTTRLRGMKACYKHNDLYH